MPVHGVAVTIPEPWGERLQRAREHAGDPLAPAIPPHVTLLPPTAVLPDRFDNFVAHLEAVCADTAPFQMVLSGTGTFVRPVSPVVFVQVSRGIGSCERLEAEVRSGPVERELEFPYHPHVTVAHHLGRQIPRPLSEFDELADFPVRVPASESVELYLHDDDGVWRVVPLASTSGPPRPERSGGCPAGRPHGVVVPHELVVRTAQSGRRRGHDRPRPRADAGRRPPRAGPPRPRSAPSRCRSKSSPVRPVVDEVERSSAARRGNNQEPGGGGLLEFAEEGGFRGSRCARRRRGRRRRRRGGPRCRWPGAGLPTKGPLVRSRRRRAAGARKPACSGRPR